MAQDQFDYEVTYSASSWGKYWPKNGELKWRAEIRTDEILEIAQPGIFEVRDFLCQHGRLSLFFPIMDTMRRLQKRSNTFQDECGRLKQENYQLHDNAKADWDTKNRLFKEIDEKEQANLKLEARSQNQFITIAENIKTINRLHKLFRSANEYIRTLSRDLQLYTNAANNGSKLHLEFTESMRVNAYEMTGHRCMMCEEIKPLEALTLDHIWPKIRGGGACWLNLGILCLSHNSHKKDRTGAEWDYLSKELWKSFRDECRALEQKFGCPCHGLKIGPEQVQFFFPPSNRFALGPG